MIKEFFTKFGQNKSIPKNTFLYTKKDNDKNIYLITKGKILLTVNDTDIAIVWEGEISGEKSFLTNTAKPINAKAITDVEVLYITPEIFINLQPEEKNNFLKAITLHISDRVYLLNDIITNISYINHYILNQEPQLSLVYFKQLFNNLLELENIYIYKTEHNAILPIFESKLECNWRQTKSSNSHLELVVEKNHIKLNLDNYYLIMEVIEFKKRKYIIENTLIHSTNNLKYLAEKLEQTKEAQLAKFLE